MQPLPWELRNEDDSFVLTVDAVAPDETEHLVIRVVEQQQSINLECWGTGHHLPLETIPLIYKPIIVGRLLTTTEVIVKMPRGVTKLMFPLLAGVQSK